MCPSPRSFDAGQRRTTKQQILRKVDGLVLGLADEEGPRQQVLWPWRFGPFVAVALVLGLNQ